MSARVSASAPLAPVVWSEDTGTGRPSSVRTVDFDAHGGLLQAPAVSRASVQGWLPGPCLVEEPAATTLRNVSGRAGRIEQLQRRDDAGVEYAHIADGGHRPVSWYGSCIS
jgi:hypothetical protein